MLEPKKSHPSRAVAEAPAHVAVAAVNSGAAESREQFLAPRALSGSKKAPGPGCSKGLVPPLTTLAPCKPLQSRWLLLLGLKNYFKKRREIQPDASKRTLSVSSQQFARICPISAPHFFLLPPLSLSFPLHSLLFFSPGALLPNLQVRVS